MMYYKFKVKIFKLHNIYQEIFFKITMNTYLIRNNVIGVMLCLVLSGSFYLPLKGQPPKREFRGVWVSTVANIDWPSSPSLTSSQQKEEILKILDLHQQNRINAIILQVRPAADAIYPSDLEPWSRYLTGEQGRAPEPFYDPLEFWIAEAHRRGMEIHAWFNPYRIKLNPADELSDDHVSHAHPEWMFSYGTHTYFSPAHPEVWEFVKKVVIDVVTRYDVDAIHFDDYFYPYRIHGEEIPDSLEFLLFGEDYYPDMLEEWRRHNVDTIIQVLSTAIKAVKPWVKFGISPFGVWRNRAEDPMGSETKAGTTNYDGLYADVITWQRNGWIDYLMPQLYWRDDHPAANFSTLAYWWNDFGYGRSVYLGLAPYRIQKKSKHKLWRKEKYFLQQIDILRSLEEVSGYGYFSSRHFFREDFRRLNRKIQNHYCPFHALVPTMPWIDNGAPFAPGNLRLEGDAIVWDVADAKNEMERARFFVVYRFNGNEKQFLKGADRIVGVTGEQHFTVNGDIVSGIYRISSLDRLSNESQLSVLLEID